MEKMVNVRVDERGNQVRSFETRMEIEDGKLRGYAAVFDVLSLDLGGYKERIRRGAFTKHLAEGADVRALWQHNPSHVLGRMKSKTLEVVEDIHGLRYIANPPDTQWARDALVSVSRGDVDQSSFQFRTVTDEWNMEEDYLVCTVLEARLFDVSPVTFPAYETTSVSVRSVNVLNLGDDNGSARLAILRRRLELLDVEI